MELARGCRGRSEAEDPRGRLFWSEAGARSRPKGRAGTKAALSGFPGRPDLIGPKRSSRGMDASHPEDDRSPADRVVLPPDHLDRHMGVRHGPAGQLPHRRCSPAGLTTAGLDRRGLMWGGNGARVLGMTAIATMWILTAILRAGLSRLVGDRCWPRAMLKPAPTAREPLRRRGIRLRPRVRPLAWMMSMAGSAGGSRA